MKRDHIPLKVKLASALLQWARSTLTEASSKKFYEDAKKMTADQIISLFQFHHHPIPHAAGGPDEPWNLEWEWRNIHGWITAKETVPQIAKVRRLTVAQAELQRILTKPAGHRRKRKGRWPRGRKILNRRRRQR